MHSGGKGISSSALPYKRSAPSWCKATATEVKESICKLARKGMTPSQIGVVLRDSNGIPQVRQPAASCAQRHAAWRAEACNRLKAKVWPPCSLSVHARVRVLQAISVVLHAGSGCSQVASVTSTKILRLLKAAGLAPELPEDLYHLIKKMSLLFVPLFLSPSLLSCSSLLS